MWRPEKRSLMARGKGYVSGEVSSVELTTAVHQGGACIGWCIVVR